MDALNDHNFNFQGADTMPKVDSNNVPKFSELPIKPDKPKESSWCLNLRLGMSGSVILAAGGTRPSPCGAPGGRCGRWDFV